MFFLAAKERPRPRVMRDPSPCIYTYYAIATNEAHTTCSLFLIENFYFEVFE
jgi:hypothetical protein